MYHYMICRVSNFSVMSYLGVSFWWSWFSYSGWKYMFDRSRAKSYIRFFYVSLRLVTWVYEHQVFLEDVKFLQNFLWKLIKTKILYLQSSVFFFSFPSINSTHGLLSMWHFVLLIVKFLSMAMLDKWFLVKIKLVNYIWAHRWGSRI